MYDTALLIYLRPQQNFLTILQNAAVIDLELKKKYIV